MYGTWLFVCLFAFVSAPYVRICDYYITLAYPLMLAISLGDSLDDSRMFRSSSNVEMDALFWMVEEKAIKTLLIPNQNSFEYISNVSRGFYYSKDLGIIYRRSDTEDCRICDGDQDCLSLDEARCELYLESSAILQQDELEDDNDKELAPDMRAEIDSAMYNLVDKASLDPRFKDCIPLISQYTDCTKDNICIGCNTCVCDMEGSWNCTVRQQCKPDSALDVNHRALLVVQDRLRDVHKVSKRSIPNHRTEKPMKVPYEELVEWMYGVKPSHKYHHVFPDKPTPQNSSEKLSNLVKRSLAETTTETDRIIDFDDIYRYFNLDQQVVNVENLTEHNSYGNTMAETSTTEIITPITTKSEPETSNIAFEEVFDMIADDNKSSGHSNPLDKKHNETINDYTDFAIFYDTPNATNDTIEYGVTESTVVKIFTESVIGEVTTIVLNLFNTAKDNSKETKNGMLDNTDTGNELDNRMNDSNVIELDAVNVMKREIQVNDTTEITTLANENITQSYETDAVQDLESSVLRPLNSIINDKQKEIDELIRIKANLISYMRTNNIIFNNNDSVTDSNQPSYLSIYKLEVTPPFLDDLRRSNTSVLDNYLLKLKRDVYQVIKDIVGIQKHSDPKNLTNDIKFLIRAMKYYVNKNGFKKLKRPKTVTQNFRRNNWETFEHLTGNKVVDNFIRMLQIIDKDMPSSDALQPLSQDTRKIIKRVIKNHYCDEFSVVGLRVYDPHYNLANDIQNIGSRWEKTSDNIANSLPSERIYHLKLLHFVLSTDVTKIKEALALIDFAHTRRMVPIDENVGEEIMTKINLDLRAIDQKIMAFIKRKALTQKVQHTMRRGSKNKRKKISFLTQIKKLLRSSKTDVRQLLRKKVPKSVIVKELARKKLDRLTKRKLSQYEQTMRKWQNNLKVSAVRNKRSLHLRNGMKSIIPKYLRRKVNYTAHKKIKRKTHTSYTTTLKPEVTTKIKKKFY